MVICESAKLEWLRVVIALSNQNDVDQLNEMRKIKTVNFKATQYKVWRLNEMSTRKSYEHE